MRRDKLFGNMFMRLAAFTLMAFTCAGEMWGANTAPINPRFLEWQRKREVKLSEINVQTNEVSQSSRKRRLSTSGDGESEPHILGYVPDLVDYSYLKDINFQGANKTGVLAADPLPHSFDLRTTNRVTSIKNQGNFGTCWAHATYASLESCLLSQGEGTFDFSEKHLAATHGRDLGYSDGGNATIAAAYLTRWSGPVAESEDPYPTGAWTSSPEGTPLGHVQNVRILTPMSTGNDTEEIKRVVYEVGAVYASYTHVNAALSSDGKNFYWNGDTSIYNPDYDGGHAVTIIGWDDNYPKDNFKYTPPYNGAFLVKNSWGANRGDKGCFWVSYWDATFGGSELVCFNSLEPTDNYGDIYQHDPLGKVASYGVRAIMYGANVFVARKNDLLAAVGFYANAPNTKYTINIYVGCTATSPISETLKLTQSGIVENCGYATIPLDKEVPISKGQRFSIVLRLNTPGYNYPLAFEAYYRYEYPKGSGKWYWTPTSEAIASTGESFISNDGSSWTDFTQVYPNGNLCFKAYTKSNTPAKPTLLSIVVKPEDEKTMSLKPEDKVQMKCEATYSNNAKSNVTDAAQWSLTSGRNYATLSSSGLLTAKNVTVLEPQAITVQAIYTEDGIIATNRYGFSMAETPPEAPTDVTVSQGTDTSCIHVNWTAPAGATEYAVYRAAANNVKNAYHLENVNVAKYHDTGSVKPIVPGVDYWYFVKAKNSSGTSGFSEGAMGWRKLSPPEVTASDTLTDKVTLEWGEVEGATHYRVYRADEYDGEKIVLCGWQTARTFDDVPPEKDIPYCYYVVAAVDASGNRPSDYSIVADGMMVSPVTVDYLEIKGDASIASGGYADYTADAICTDKHRVENVSPVMWTVSGDGATVSGNRVTVATVTANKKVTLKASYTEDGKTARGEKQITITAVKPAAPRNVAAAATETGVTVTWSMVAGAATYKVYRDGVALGLVRQGTSCPDTTAMPGVAYVYAVSAVNSAGESDLSAGVEATVPLAAPTGVTATDDRTDGVLVSWRGVNGATYYRVSRATSENGAKTELGTWTTDASFLDTSAVAGVTYCYFVRAATSSGGANASEYSSPATIGRRIPSRTLLSIEISGMDKVAASKSAVYTCVATYNDETTETVTPTWSASPTSAATINENGLLTAKAVSANREVTVVASFTDGTTKTANKTVTIVAPEKATAEIENMVVSTRWPFAPIVDIDYTLVVNPVGAKAIVGVVGHDEDHGIDMAATTLSGDGADGLYIAAGAHRLTWNIGADYPNFHAKAFSVSMTATPSLIRVPENITASESTSGVTLNWNAVEDADEYEVWRGTEVTTNGAERIATVAGTTTYFDSTGIAGTTYWYWLRASGEDGVGEFAQPITGTRVVILPVSLEISGPSFVTAGGTATYTCIVTRNDSTNGSVAPTWSITSGTSYASINSSGVLTANGTAVQRSVTIQASYTQNGATVMATKQVTINTKSVTIFFNGNGGTTSVSSQPYTSYGTYGSLPEAIRTGYTFAGWWTAASGGTQVTTESTVPMSDTALYAHWSPKSYTIHFDSNGGVGAMADMIVCHDVVTNLSANAFSKENFRFGGWATNSDDVVVYADGAGITPASDMTLYAVWGYSAPWNVVVTTEMPKEITIAWAAATGATSYQVMRNTSSDYSTAMHVATVTGTNYIDSVGNYTTEYYYWIVALNGSSAAVSAAAIATRAFDLLPIRNLLNLLDFSVEGDRDGYLDDIEIEAAMCNPNVANLDEDPSKFSAEELSIFTRIQTLNTDKELISAVMRGNFSAISDDAMEELASISYDMKELAKRRDGRPYQVAATQSDYSSPQITISWSASSRGVYNVWRTQSNDYTGNATRIAQVTNVLTYVDESVSFRQAYSYKISAVFSDGSEILSTGYAYGYWGDWCWEDVDDGNIVDVLPLRNLLNLLDFAAGANRNGYLDDNELNRGMRIPSLADLDGDSGAISDEEMSIFLRIQLLNADKELISSIMRGNFDYRGMTLAHAREIGSLSDEIKELTKNRN